MKKKHTMYPTFLKIKQKNSSVTQRQPLNNVLTILLHYITTNFVKKKKKHTCTYISRNRYPFLSYQMICLLKHSAKCMELTILRYITKNILSVKKKHFPETK